MVLFFQRATGPRPPLCSLEILVLSKLEFLFQFEQAKSELIWQQDRTNEELAEIEAEIRGIEKAIADKAGPLKVAYTRLELRKERPGIENCTYR